MTVLRVFATREEALEAAQRLIEYRLEARVMEEPDGRFAVRLEGGSRSLALDILDHGRPRFDRTVPWARSRSASRLSISQFGAVAGGAVAVFLLWLVLTDGYGAPVLIVSVAALVAIGGGLWFVTPEAFDVEAIRPVTSEVVAIGALFALAQRVLFDLIPLRGSAYRTYPLWEWVVAAFVPVLVLTVVVGLVVRARGHDRVRRTMTLFGAVGLTYGVTAGATYLLDIGFTAGRWGIVPVWAVLGIYPVLTIPFHVFGAGILGWGWASGGRWVPLAVVLVATTQGLFHFAVVRSPFWGPLFVIGFGLIWMWLFAANPQSNPMVARIPRRLIPDDD